MTSATINAFAEDDQALRAARADWPQWPQNLPPAIIMGGRANSLSVARSISRLGARAYALNEPGAFVGNSRHCTLLDVRNCPGQTLADAWAEFLLGPKSDFLRGALLLACGDDAIELLLTHREALARRYVLDDSNPSANRAMLNKLSTYQAAAEAGVPTPGFWIADSAETLSEIRSSLTYPIIVKPLLGHIFEGKTGKKLLIAGNFDETVSAVGAMTATGTGAVLMEMIPGPDDRLCSYFTYLDENSEPMFHFTKRVIRRYPVLSGTACYHITDWIPEAVELGVRLFKHVRLRGVANVEFKRDVRDGRLKLIECNARFTASDSLVARSGVDIGAFVYNHLTGRAQKQIKTFKQGLRMWDPIRDFQCFLYLRKTNNMKLSQWLASVMHRQTFPYFSLLDPMPALARLTLPIRNKLKPAAQTGEAV